MKTRTRIVLMLALALTLIGAALTMAQQAGPGANGAPPRPKGPCDIYAPAGGYANAAAQDAFCANTYGWVTTIYDQSPKHNHLIQAPRGANAVPGTTNIKVTSAADLSVGDRSFSFLISGALLASQVTPQAPPSGRKRLLAWGDTITAYQHDSVSHALATVERLGRESGAFDTYIRTDSQLITRQPVPAPARNTRNLNYFDAIFFIGTGDNLNEQQKKDLMAFIKEDGKGFVGAHTGDDAFFDWPEFGEMIGGYFDNHPWSVFDAPVIVEDPNFPAMKGFPARFSIRDEIYQHKNFSRAKVHVLARLDASRLDFTKPEIHRTDKDFPVAWAKMFGKGRVFYSTFGHADEAWDNPLVQKMYLEAVKWAMRMQGADVTP